MSDSLLEKYDIVYPYCGFDCPAGWRELVEKLIKDLIALGWDKDLHQVKEKFGGLRFYTGYLTPEMEELVTQAESISMKICIDCGKSPTKRSPGYWIEFLCSDCIDSRKKP